MCVGDGAVKGDRLHIVDMFLENFYYFIYVTAPIYFTIFVMVVDL